MFEPVIIEQSIEYNYRFQKNMYFDGRKKLTGASIYFSKYIEDHFWNFANNINITEKIVPSFIQEIEKEMKTLNRQPAFYITPLTTPLNLLIENLGDLGYQRRFQDTWMFFDSSSVTKIHANRMSDMIARVVNKEKDVEDFINVYSKAYADEPTTESPEGSIPQTY